MKRSDINTILMQYGQSWRSVTSGESFNFNGSENAVIQMFIKAYIPAKIALAAVYGYQPADYKSEISAYLTDVYGLCTYFGNYQITHAAEIIKSIEAGHYYDMGMKYPMFDRSELIKKYGLFSLGVFSHSNNIKYEVWTNEKRTVYFSFAPGEIGDGGYAGATFKEWEDVFNFLDWFLSNPVNYIKDLNLFYNGLGGLSYSEILKIIK